MSTDSEMMAHVQNMFLDETMSIIDDYTADLRNLPQSENRMREIARLSRDIHSIMGSAASVGFTDLADFSRANGDLLAAMSSDPVKSTDEIMSLITTTLNLLREWVLALKKDGRNSAPPPGVEALQAQLSSSTSQMGSPAQKVQAAQGLVRKNNMTTGSDAGTTTKQPSKGPPIAKKTANLVKIDSDRLDSLLDLIGELVVIKSQIIADDQLAQSADARLSSLLMLLDKSVRDLYAQTLSLRMTPVKGLMLKLDRAIRDAADQVDKEFNLRLYGEECELDRLLIEKIGDPLMHLVRNAVDHGIENAAARRKAGKTDKGNISITASTRGASILFEIVDDGRGIDRNLVIQKAVEKSIIADAASAAHLSDAEIYNFLFMSGFSTAEKLTELSGRGVGLDIVKSNVQALKGNVEVSSTLGHGSKFTLRMPLTTAIADGLIVRLANERYILPLDAVDEILSKEAVSVVSMGDQGDCVSVHQKFFPLVNLVSEFGLDGGRQDIFIIINGGQKKFVIRVDEILGQSQVVQKTLHESLFQAKGIGGTAILGDGRVALVMDVCALQPQ